MSITEERLAEIQAMRDTIGSNGLNAARLTGALDDLIAEVRALTAQRDAAQAKVRNVERAVQGAPTSWNDESDEYGLGWAHGATAALRSVVAALRPSPVAADDPSGEEK